MTRYLTDAEIERAKRETKYSIKPAHSCNDAIRIVYQWLDAQTIIKNPSGTGRGIKHLVEGWSGFYISISEVEVAAHLYPGIYGRHPYYNIHANLVLPADRRLSGLEGTSKRARRHNPKDYVTMEDPTGGSDHIRVSRYLNKNRGPGQTLEQVLREMQKDRRW